MELVARAGLTRLGCCYYQVPVLLLPPFHFASEPAALLYLINPSVGLMDGDAHYIDVAARTGTRTVVTGQSASRIHPALSGYASQQWSIRVDDGAELVVLPGPTIPYRGARFYQRVQIDLAATARMVWGDVWYPGRHLYGADPEVFVFDRLVQHLEVRRCGHLVYRDRFDWRGPWTADDREWHLGGRLAAGSLFATGQVREGSNESDAFSRAVLPLASGDSCIRIYGDPQAVTRECARFAFAAAGNWSDVSPWLSGRNNFSSNHWFSAPPS